MPPLVSVVMPTANRQQFVPLAIECVLAQTFTDYELLIVDDGAEETPVPEDPRIRYVRLSGGSRTTGEKRNICAQLARGEIIVHQDDDDWSAPTRIESQLKDLEASGKPFVGYHRISYWHPATRLAYQYHGTRPYACGTSQCYLKSYWQQNNFNAKLVGEDSDFSARARQHGLLDSFDGTQLIVARAHDGNTGRPLLGHHQFPEVTTKQLPPAFLKTIGVAL
jgi:glycosyltransferase involved in cell wall biosynthesis